MEKIVFSTNGAAKTRNPQEKKKSRHSTYTLHKKNPQNGTNLNVKAKL